MSRVLRDRALVEAHLRQVLAEPRRDADGPAVPEHGHAALAAQAVQADGARVVGADALHRGVHLDAASAHRDLRVELAARPRDTGAPSRSPGASFSLATSSAVSALCDSTGKSMGRSTERVMPSPPSRGPGWRRYASPHSAAAQAAERQVALHLRDVALGEVPVGVQLEVQRPAAGQIVQRLGGLA